MLNGAGVSQPMQVLDQQWELRYPPDLLLTDSQGVFVPDPATPLDRSDWLSNLPKSLSLPSWSNIGRMIGAIVCVFLVIAVIWARQRYGMIVGIILPVVLIGIGIALVAPALQSTRRASAPASGSVSAWFYQEQKNAADFAEAAKRLDGTINERLDAPMATPQAMTPKATEPNMPQESAKSESLPELQTQLNQKLVEEAAKKS